MEILVNCQWEWNGAAILENSLAAPQKAKHKPIPSDKAVPFLRIDIPNRKGTIHNNLCVNVYSGIT